MNAHTPPTNSLAPSAVHRALAIALSLSLLALTSCRLPVSSESQDFESKYYSLTVDRVYQQQGVYYAVGRLETRRTLSVATVTVPLLAEDGSKVVECVAISQRLGKGEAWAFQAIGAQMVRGAGIPSPSRVGRPSVNSTRLKAVEVEIEDREEDGDF